MGKILEISLPSEETKRQIQEEAERRKCTASKYILTLFEESRRPASPSAGPEIEHLRQENRKMEVDLKGKDLLLSKQEAELRKLRGSAFLHSSWDADIDSDLLKALKAGPIHDHKLLDHLGATDQDAMRAISRQLQILETAGFIARTARGWCWKK
jgi:hypothetical protein